MDTFIAVVKGFIYKKRKNCLVLIFYCIYNTPNNNLKK